MKIVLKSGKLVDIQQTLAVRLINRGEATVYVQANEPDERIPAPERKQRKPRK